MRPHDDPHGFDNLQDEIRREAERVDRDLSDFAMICHVSTLVTDAGHPITQQDPRPILGGTAEQVIADLGRFADAGYSLVVIRAGLSVADVRGVSGAVGAVGQRRDPGGQRDQARWRMVDGALAERIFVPLRYDRGMRSCRRAKLREKSNARCE